MLVCTMLTSLLYCRAYAARYSLPTVTALARLVHQLRDVGGLKRGEIDRDPMLALEMRQPLLQPKALIGVAVRLALHQRDEPYGRGVSRHAAAGGGGRRRAGIQSVCA